MSVCLSVCLFVHLSVHGVSEVSCSRTTFRRQFIEKPQGMTSSTGRKSTSPLSVLQHKLLIPLYLLEQKLLEQALHDLQLHTDLLA